MSGDKLKMESTNDSLRPLILYVIPGEETGSNMIFARRQLAALQDRGVRIRAFYLRSRRSASAVWREWCRFRRELAELNPDIVHPQFGTMTAFFAVMSTSRPVVVTYRGSDLNPVPSINRLRRWLGLLMSQVSALRARHIVCVSEELVNRLWWCRSKATVIPSGVDTQQFFPVRRDFARTQLGWRAHARVVLFNAGRQPKVKRLDLAEKTFEIVRRSMGDAIMHILNGSTPPDHLPLIMNAADCLLVTSDYEGSPNIVKEALACNLPVVSVDAGDIAQRLDGVLNSYVVERDAAMLASSVRSVLRSCERSNGAMKVSSVSLDATSRALNDLYRKALGMRADKAMSVQGDRTKEWR